MDIDNSVLEKIEEIFNIKLYPVQIEYLMGDSWRWPLLGQRRTGKTFAYCLKLALTDTEHDNIINFKSDFMRYSDENFTLQYHRWFKHYFYGIWMTLKENGMKVRPAIF